MEATDRLNVVIMAHQEYSELLIKNYRLERERRKKCNKFIMFLSNDGPPRDYTDEDKHY